MDTAMFELNPITTICIPHKQISMHIWQLSKSGDLFYNLALFYPSKCPTETALVYREEKICIETDYEITCSNCLH